MWVVGRHVEVRVGLVPRGETLTSESWTRCVYALHSLWSRVVAPKSGNRFQRFEPFKGILRHAMILGVEAVAFKLWTSNVWQVSLLPVALRRSAAHVGPTPGQDLILESLTPKRVSENR